MNLFPTVMVTNTLGAVMVSIVIALQLGLSQWGTRDSSSARSITGKRQVNIPILWTSGWLLYLNVISITYASIWHGPNFAAGFNGLVFCDIFSRVQFFASISVVCGVTATVRNLCLIISPKGPPLYFQTAWKKNVVDLAICVVFPVIQTPLMYLVQSQRFVVVETMGCLSLVSNNWLVVIIYFMWFVIWSAVAAVYALFTCYYVYRRKKDFSDILSCTGSGLTTSQFGKLLLFGALIICGQLPVSMYLVIQRCNPKRLDTSAYSFSRVHAHYGDVNFIMSGWDRVTFIDRWMYTSFSFVAFFVFGLGRDARLAYTKILYLLGFGWLLRTIGKVASRTWQAFRNTAIMKRVLNKDTSSTCDTSDSSSSSRGRSSKGTTSKPPKDQPQRHGYRLGLPPRPHGFNSNPARRGLIASHNTLYSPSSSEHSHPPYSPYSITSHEPNKSPISPISNFQEVTARDAIDGERWSPTAEYNYDVERQDPRYANQALWYYAATGGGGDLEDSLSKDHKNALVVQVESCSSRSSTDSGTR